MCTSNRHNTRKRNVNRLSPQCGHCSLTSAPPARGRREIAACRCAAPPHLRHTPCALRPYEAISFGIPHALRAMLGSINTGSGRRRINSVPCVQISKTQTRLWKHAPIPNNPPAANGNYETDSATWPEDTEDEEDPVSPQPLPRLATQVAPAAAAGAAGPSISAHDGPASRTRSKTRANKQAN